MDTTDGIRTYQAPVSIKVSVEVHSIAVWVGSWSSVLPPQSVLRVFSPRQLHTNVNEAERQRQSKQTNDAMEHLYDFNLVARERKGNN